jgi:3-hydroxyisobutyrate dehydrogenase
MADPDTAPTGPVGATGVIGLGEIGRGLAASLLRAGAELTVCDVRPEAAERFAAEARVAATPSELAAHCDVMLVAVVDDSQVRSVVTGPGGILDGARPGSAVVVVSTITVTTVVEVAAEAARRDVTVLDCGVSGGPGAAADGDLICMVGGPPGAVDAVRPVLEAVGSTVLAMGPLGAGLKAKLARNLVQYGSWMAAYEAQRIAEAAGIPLPLLATAIRESDRRIGGAATLMFRESVAPLRPDVPTDAGLIGPMSAAAGLAHKDLGAVRSLAASLGLDAPVARLAEELCDGVFGIAGPSGTAGESGEAG